MNDLQLALIGAGAVVVVGVWGYNKWQEIRQRRLAEQVFRGDQADALLPAQDADDKAAPSAVAPATTERLEPVLDDLPAEPPAFTPPPLPPALADDVADCVVRIHFKEPLAAPSLWAAQMLLAPHVGKRLVWLGCDEAAGKWRQLSAGDSNRYALVCASLQLVDRRGAVPDTELSVFLEGVGKIAQDFAGSAEIPEREAVLMHARALDDFCAGVDLQLGVNVIGGEGNVFAGDRIDELAHSAGLSLGEDGIYRLTDDAGLVLFVLANTGTEPFSASAMGALATGGITFSLDVPRVADGASAFDRLLVVAQQFSEGLGGLLVDGQGHPLSAEMIATIRSKVAELQARMLHRQIAAGSGRALRLFS